jgi:tRNA(Ile)-lysidine synthase
MVVRPLEVSLYKILKEKRDKKFLLAVSGGMDSMALFYIFKELAKKLSIQFSVAHIHHGPSLDSLQRAFRDGARAFVAKQCVDAGVPFFSNTVEEEIELKSEADFRRLRLEFLSQTKKQTASDIVVFAHHREDLLETRLLRLIRGTGPEGLVAMRVEKGAVLRPFLRHSKQELKRYLELVQGEFVIDPSNGENRYLRNWLRNTWLPALEVKVPGGAERLEQSLQNIADLAIRPRSLKSCFDGEKLLRSEFMLLDLADKRRVLGDYLRRHIGRDFGLSHINELIKRLDVEQNELTFKVLKKNWRANARHIWCESEKRVQ